MRLFVVDDYRARDVHYEKGQVLEVTPDTAAFLMADAPGCFALQPPEVKALENPPKDKMLRKGKTK